MSAKSTIEWTDATWNPVRGCVKVSPGCKHCYAEAFAERWRGVKGHPYEHGFDPRLVPEKLSEPLHWEKPRRIFVNSMSDLFGHFVSNEYIAAVFGVAADCQHHTFQILTKRAERMPEWFEWFSVWGMGHRGGSDVFAWALHAANALRGESFTPRSNPRTMHRPPWPLLNVHLGVSVESAQYRYRLDRLRDAPATVRFVSFEPLLGDVGALDLSGIHQVIVGAENARRARPMREDWVRSIRDQAKAAGCAFFYKQRLEGGRKVSLPLLDGQQWAEMPK